MKKILLGIVALLLMFGVFVVYGETLIPEVIDEPTELLRNIPKEASSVFDLFMQAIQKAEWESAIKLCSDDVRQAATKYISLETYFRKYVLIKEKAPNRHYGVIHCIDGSYKIQIGTTESSSRFRFLRLLKEKDKWVIDFPTG